jgi:hypothetical protein
MSASGFKGQRINNSNQGKNNMAKSGRFILQIGEVVR